MTTATVLISCADKPGLVASVARFDHEHGGNILHADQHSDPSDGTFLQRVEWDLEGFQLPPDQIATRFATVAEQHAMDWHVHISDEIPKVAILVSKSSHCLFDLLARWQSNELRVDISLVISNHDELRPVAKQFGVDYHYLPVNRSSKAAQEQQILQALNDKGIQLVILARYMQILTPLLVDPFRHAMINIHHSFLPAFAGARPYHRAYERGVKLIGATAHYVTSDLDEGPIIAQDVARVSHRDGVDELMAKGRNLEKVVLATAVQHHVQHKIIVHGNKTAVFG